MIIGGGRITYYLAERILNIGLKVKIIEKSSARCAELCELLPDALIINGDGTDHHLLDEEDLSKTDAFVALTDMDEENFISSLYAAKHRRQTGHFEDQPAGIHARHRRHGHRQHHQPKSADGPSDRPVRSCHAEHRWFEGRHAFPHSGRAGVRYWSSPWPQHSAPGRTAEKHQIQKQPDHRGARPYGPRHRSQRQYEIPPGRHRHRHYDEPEFQRHERHLHLIGGR